MVRSSNMCWYSTAEAYIRNVVVQRYEFLPDIFNRHIIIAYFCTWAAALGYGQLHIVETPNATYKQSARISKGTEKWLDVRRWTDMRECMQRMREQGRQVLVTHCNADAIPIAVRSACDLRLRM